MQITKSQKELLLSIINQQIKTNLEQGNALMAALVMSDMLAWREQDTKELALVEQKRCDLLHIKVEILGL